MNASTLPHPLPAALAPYATRGHIVTCYDTNRPLGAVYRETGGQSWGAVNASGQHAAPFPYASDAESWVRRDAKLNPPAPAFGSHLAESLFAIGADAMRRAGATLGDRAS